MQGTRVRSLVGELRSHMPQGKLSPSATTTELARLNQRAHMPQTTEPTCSGAHSPQLEREKPTHHNEEPALQRKIPHTAMKTPRAAIKTQHSQKKINKLNK